MADPEIAVIIPALNEEETVGGVVAALPRERPTTVLVVDNGSSDGTAEAARRAGAVVLREEARGYGAACLAGLAALPRSIEVVVFIDADGSDDPAGLPRLVEPILAGGADLVIGSRTLGEAERGALSFQQRFGNRLACALIRLFFRQRYTDLGPFRAVRRSSLAAMRMADRTWGWTVEMQIKAARLGLRVREIPIPYRRRAGGASKISGTVIGSARAGWKIITTIVAARLRAAPRPRHGGERSLSSNPETSTTRRS